ncbi:MAG: PAS domain S-box protein [Gammaproteobacteria bacterium]|uniref:hybrid sensor histidine kinase/response regulator n=1 Tax=Rhodoferax sp. TaxID=50421 RepID=UPI0017C229BE|nr:MASE3 domain-containing protein [Rhodoferax sp.]MBU3897407.1 PAS domain S-box protein [Gammaproteobacteria bacterium]MBA3057133.1 PAS domain S-box protein [Rhodoferax sp.]MBU3999286.1 PAS domain S-box protein [Gammaproteobacteria bacterium]MBU4018753.1 PAS domain S-box protein [Gammaproteobacteria bacterium]MBU4079708.1 PAS domain S-box protein [Gammaproteobacteria bacterium]
MTSATAERHALPQQVILVLIFGLLALLALTLSLLQSLPIPLQHYLPIHTTLEFASIGVAFLVFATVWHTPAKEISASLLLIALALFAAGWLDFAHTLSFKGMPALVTPASVEKGIAFWLAARLMVAVALLGASIYPHLKPPSIGARYAMLGAYAIINLAVFWVVIFHEAELPRTYIDGAGLTPLKSGFEFFITGLLLLAAWRYQRLASRSDSRTDSRVFPLLFSAASIAALSELFFVRYQEANDLQNLLGHLYKIVSYALIYQAFFVASIQRPYSKLAEQSAKLLRVNEKLRTRSLALASTAMPVLVTDLHGKVQWRNRASHQLTAGTDSESENGLNLFDDFVTPERKVADSIRQTVEAGKVWRGLVDFKDGLGNWLILDRTVTPLRNDDGGIEGYVSVAEDVTKGAQARLRHQRVLETAIDGFWIVDAQGRLLEVNEAYARMSGYPVAELLSMNISQLEVVEFLDDIQARMRTIMAQGRCQFETRHRHKLGHEIAIDLSATYDSESKNFFVFLHDRSEHVHAAAARQELQRQLQQAQKMQALGQLTGGIAHDFNNILTAVLGYSNLALDRFAPDKHGKLAVYLREVITASERARDLIAKMLTFARIHPNASAQVISPAAVVQEVLAMMRPSIPSSIELKSRIGANPPITMESGELNQILVNLLINARDAIDGHGMIEVCLDRVDLDEQICACCQQRLSGACVALEVSDNGSGIAPQHKPRLFDPFFTTKDVGKGTGLGLSMVQGVLRRCGGHVVVDSQLGQGSRFRLLFPIAAATQAPAAEPASLANSDSGQGQLIWVVDDEPAVARFLAELLTGWGYRVRQFNESDAVLAALQSAPNEVDLLISDQTMPGLSGVELAQRVHGLRPALPIILCSGNSADLDHAELLRHGIRHCFAKPVAVQELRQALAEELAQSTGTESPV